MSENKPTWGRPTYNEDNSESEYKEPSYDHYTEGKFYYMQIVKEYKTGDTIMVKSKEKCIDYLPLPADAIIVRRIPNPHPVNDEE